MQTRDVLRAATDQLSAGGLVAPRVDAELLLAHCLGVDRSALLTHGEIPESAASRFAVLLQRRSAREPLQYLVGHAPFRYLDLAVGPGVFIPRPETELLIDAVLPTLAQHDGPIAVDLCSGSGALALAIASEAPHARIIAVERSPQALTWLRRNVAGGHVEVVEADIADGGLLIDLRGSVDVLVCNPPYVPSAAAVDPEVRADPAEAVFAGADGLGLMPAVLARAAELLRGGGLVAVEHDDTHADALTELCAATGHWTQIADHDDLTGRPRYLTAVRR